MPTEPSDETPWWENKIVLFDGICNLCTFWAGILLRHDADGIFKLATMQSSVGQRLLSQHGMCADHFTTMVYLERGKLFTRSDAVLRVFAQLPPPWRWCRLLLVLPKPVRDGVYNLIAQNRYRWFGTRSTCYLPTAKARSRCLDSKPHTEKLP